MLKDENILCISSIDWDFIWQGHQEIMSTLARGGNRVLFIENTGVRVPTFRDISRLKRRLINWFKGVGGIRKEAENLYVFSPLIAPFPYSRLARWINKRLLFSSLNKWMRVMDFNDPIIWTFLPTGLTLDLINNMNKKASIYYCIDNFAVSSSLARKVKSAEQKLIRQADLVFVTAKKLYNYCKDYNQRVYIFPFGVNIESFERARSKVGPYLPEDLRDIKKPLVGYIGGIHRWIDQDLLRKIAQIHPDYSFVFIGPIQTDVSILSKVKNMHFLGQKEHRELPHYVNQFTAGIIPYLLTDYTRNVYPTKLNEYLALAKPVVSTDLPEIKVFNEKYGDVVSIGKYPEEFAECLDKAVRDTDSREVIEKRIQVAQDNSWKKRIEEMSGLIVEAVERRMHDKDLVWKESLIRFYRTAHRRLMKISIGLLLMYVLLFRTPFLWFMASPLKISEPPRPADAIVVLAGGVGESGKAGQGYEERVKYAVELYKKGFAENLIFSSGYQYAVKEAEVMKLLAISMGVPEEAVLLNDKAANTHENVKFTKEILNREGWDSILLVSSPYHMRRAQLVYKKVAPEIRLTSTPIPISIFYGDGSLVKIKHIRAISHEYLGILYYWFKEYI